MRAFTLIELIVVLVIIGLVAAIGLPSITKARLEAENESKRAMAVQFQTAKLNFIEAAGYEQASSSWPASENDRYTFLASNYLPSNIPTLANAFTASGYTLTLGSLDAPVTLSGPLAVRGTTGDIPLYKY